MNKVTIKNMDLEIAPINLGGNVFGWTLDEKQSFDYIDLYYPHFDDDKTPVAEPLGGSE